MQLLCFERQRSLSILTTMSNHDLSDYELLRLENMRRNNEFLASLGIQQHKPAPVVKKEVIQQITKREIKRENIQPERSSKRIKGLSPVKYDDEELVNEPLPEETGINYEAKPEVSLASKSQSCLVQLMI